ncbi:hypothetical protein O1611_g1812 [Lasiodiplodia mahajangana]|uniref:Uncharacterized protein n=1 Tax=Lasiodiplodia mahajangana TaxID=1108764 RepID=A0ACC2JWU7_9PEZI|nr:hypothetical protein O1611_g1812 [Lasiodiplodia mahajangana]
MAKSPTTIRSRSKKTGNVLYDCLAVRVLLRASGLGVVAALANDEPPKQVVYKSRATVGEDDADSLKFAALQVAAKIQVCHRSPENTVGAMVLYAIREDLLFGVGVPLGLVGADQALTQLSFFWSLEFWGGVLSYRRVGKNYLRYPLLALVCFGGLLASTAGPAAAILIIPRMIPWPVGGGIFWLNGSDTQLWPAYLDKEYLGTVDCSTIQNQLTSPWCPSYGFQSLQQLFGTWWGPEPHSQFDQQGFDIRKVIHYSSSREDRKDTWVYTTHAPTANLQDAIVTRYRDSLDDLRVVSPDFPFEAKPANIYLAKSKLYQVKTKVPLVRTCCHLQPPITPNSMPSSVYFPKFEEFQIYRNSSEIGPVIEMDTVELLNQEMVRRNYSLPRNHGFPIVAIPVEMPEKEVASLGLLLIHLDTGSTAELPRWDVMACSIDTRWAKGRSIIETNGLRPDLVSHEFIGDKVANPVRTELDIAEADSFESLSWTPQDDGNLERIRLRMGWYDLLSPLIPSGDLNMQLQGSTAEMNVTMLEQLIKLTVFPNSTLSLSGQNRVKKSVEVIIAATVADGLSWCGAHMHIGASLSISNWQAPHTVAYARTMVRLGEPVQSFPLPEALDGGAHTQMMMRAVYTGYVISITNSFDRFCVVLLLAYAAVAVAHTLWCLKPGRGRAHEAWSTIPELVALSQQSDPEPASVLSNTCAGVRSLETMGRVAVVECVNEPGREELQLKFGKDFRTSSIDGIAKPLPGVEYGVKEYELGKVTDNQG